MKAEEIRAEFQEVYKDLFDNKVLREVHKGNGLSIYAVAEKFWAIIPFMDKLPEQAYLLLTVNDEEARSVIFDEKKFGQIFEDRKKQKKMFVLTPETKQRIYNVDQKRMAAGEADISVEREQRLFDRKQWKKDRSKKLHGVWRGIGYMLVFFSMVEHFVSSELFVNYSWSELSAFLVAAGVPLILGRDLIMKNKEDELKMWELKEKKALSQDNGNDWYLQLKHIPTFGTIYCLVVFGLVSYHLFQILKRNIWDIGIIIVCAIAFVLVWGFIFNKQTKDLEIELRRLFNVKKDVWGEHFVALDLKEKKMYMVYHRFEDESDDNPSEKYGFQEITEEQMRQLARECNVDLEVM